ncbi:unnamed protein product, partial [Polarella glacialis]
PAAAQSQTKRRDPHRFAGSSQKSWAQLSAAAAAATAVVFRSAAARRCSSQELPEVAARSSRRALLTSAAVAGSLVSREARGEGPDCLPPLRVFEVKGLENRELGPEESWLDRLVDKDVVLLGEHHNQASDHQMQLMVIERLRRAAGDRPLAVGLEMVQQRFQP